MEIVENKFDAALRYSLSEIRRAGDDPDKLPPALRTIVIVHAAQGIIDNGGLQYFFENDFDDLQRPYSFFSDAYRMIGALDEAALLDAAVRLFPFDEPQKHVKDRRAFLASLIDEGPFRKYDKALCGNKRVWELLGSYVQQHAESFPDL